MYSLIKRIEHYPSSNPWLALGIDGNYRFEGFENAHKFTCLDSAKEVLGKVNSVWGQAFITWHDDSPNPKCGTWGEVNLNAI